MTSAQNILVVDDDREIARLLAELLQRNGYRVEAAGSADQARSAIKGRPFDLIVLDVMMPGENGIDLCRQLRATSGVPIIMLTAVGELADRVVGLELGADDYVTKPFEGRELLARIRAVLRRSGEGLSSPGARSPDIALKSWRIDVSRKELRSSSGVLVPLSEAEFRVLRALAQRPNVIMSRDWLAEAAVGGVRNQDSRSIDILISRLRSKLQAYEDGVETITTVRGGGYVIRT